MVVVVPPEYQTAEGLRTLANYLRSSNGVKVRSGIQHEKRVDYFKGKRLVESIIEAKKWPKSLPKITDREVAIEVGNLLLQKQFFHRSEKIEGKKGYLKISQTTIFEDVGHYTWIFAGNTTWSNIATGGIIAVVIGFTLLPIWPDIAKRILWYFSVTFLIATLAFCLIRFLLFLITWIFGYEFWIFPRIFDETLSFQDSFKPIYSFEKSPPGQGYFRLGVVLLFSGFIYWACTQPTEFDGFLKAQKDFIDDLYSGNLLAEVSQDHKDNLDRIRGKVPKLDELMREMAEEDGSETFASSNSDSNNDSTLKVEVDEYGNAINDEEEEKFDDAMFEELLNRVDSNEESD